MANNDLATKFTENKYATRSEVSKELKMSTIDNIWSSILNYRSTFNSYLKIKAIDNVRLLFCQCPTILGKVNAIEAKLNKIFRDYSRLDISKKELTRFNDWGIEKALSSIAAKEEIETSFGVLSSVINGDEINNSSSKCLTRYKQALEYIRDCYVNPIDYDFIRNLYSILSGRSFDSVGYRQFDDNTYESKVLIGRVYTSAPASQIELFMANLFSFFENSNTNSFVKALIAYYYVNYIKPFDEYTDEIALLLVKAVLAHYNDLAELAAYLPLEDLLAKDQEGLSKVFFEVQKTHDVTYFVNYALTFFSKVCEDVANQLVECKKEEMKNDFYRADEATTNLVEEPVVNPAPTREDPLQKETIEEVVQVQEVVPEVKKEEPVVVKEVKNVVNQVPNESVNEDKPQELAITYTPSLSEKEAGKLEQFLLESDPNLKKGEAKFYARHCTLGKIYTIAQYKKYIRCVYETARTSMDHLAALGYYKKSAFKNKFVYTPVDKK